MVSSLPKVRGPFSGPVAAALLLSAGLPAGTLRANTLDWDNHIPGGPGTDYPNGALSAALVDVDGASTDVDVTWSEAGGGDIVPFIFLATPRVDSNNLGGGSFVNHRVAMNNGLPTHSISVTFDFTHTISGLGRPLYDLVFTLHDVDVDDPNDADSNIWQDRLTITGNSGTAFPTLSRPAVSMTNGVPDPVQVDLSLFTDISGNTATGIIGAAEGSQGSSTNQNYGDIIVRFGAMEGITSFQIFYTNGPGVAEYDPTLQTVGISDFTFSTVPVPEPGSALLLLASAASFAGLRRRFPRSPTAAGRRR